MSIEAIKKALEGVTHVWGDVNKPVLVRGVSWIAHANYDDRQAHDNAIYLKAVNPSAITDLISEIDRLQRENAALREDRYKLAYAITGGEDAPGLLDSTPTSEIVEIAQHAHRMHQGDIDRAMAAEAEVERLQTELALSKPLYSRRQIEARVKLLEEALKPFAEYMGDHLDKDNHGNPLPDDLGVGWIYLKHADFRRARNTLASTGGDHHGN